MHPETTTDPALSAEVADAQAEVSALCTDLGTVLARVQVFWDRRPDDVPHGVYGPEARRAQNELARLEKAERFDTTVRALGQGFVRGVPATTTTSPAPAQIAVVSIFAEVDATLRHQARRIQRRLAADQVHAALPSLPVNPSPAQLRRRVRALAYACTSPTLLKDLVRDLQHLVDIATTYVDGQERVAMPDPCPHCDTKSLVVNHRTHTIRCDRDPVTGQQHPCRCGDPYCRCALNPFENRHEWQRARTGPGSWWSLSDLQERRVRERLTALGVTAGQVTTWARAQHLIPENEANAAKRIRHDLVDAYETAHQTEQHPTTSEEPLS